MNTNIRKSILSVLSDERLFIKHVDNMFLMYFYYLLKFIQKSYSY